MVKLIQDDSAKRGPESVLATLEPVDDEETEEEDGDEGDGNDK